MVCGGLWWSSGLARYIYRSLFYLCEPRGPQLESRLGQIVFRINIPIKRMFLPVCEGSLVNGVFTSVYDLVNNHVCIRIIVKNTLKENTLKNGPTLKKYQQTGAVVAQGFMWLLHGTGGPRFKIWRLLKFILKNYFYLSLLFSLLFYFPSENDSTIKWI